MSIAGTSLIDEFVNTSGHPGSLVMFSVGNIPDDFVTIALISPQVFWRDDLD
ncbi:hypothetical protein JCM18918_3250 [Cutibacterium acnes JCM 18918]|nr:hypothetical protein JCM18918_3250 [Cutibacterium acnes JCM 18918]